jgi:hypothetical protein
MYHCINSHDNVMLAHRQNSMPGSCPSLGESYRSPRAGRAAEGEVAGRPSAFGRSADVGSSARLRVAGCNDGSLLA